MGDEVYPNPQESLAPSICFVVGAEHIRLATPFGIHIIIILPEKNSDVFCSQFETKKAKVTASFFSMGNRRRYSQGDVK